MVNDKLKDYLFIVVSNREPYIHTLTEKIKWTIPASGLTMALDPVMQACGGVWVAHGSGDADKEVVDPNNKVSVPLDNPKYSLKRVWLSKEEENGYYYGFANEALWPLCHIVYNRPIFRESDWNTYKKVNQYLRQCTGGSRQPKSLYFYPGLSIFAGIKNDQGTACGCNYRSILAYSLA